jgi:hypothetical protein
MDKRIQVLATMAAVLLTFPMEVRAADVPVPYISGGAGADAREELLAREKRPARLPAVFQSLDAHFEPQDPACLGFHAGYVRV